MDSSYRWTELTVVSWHGTEGYWRKNSVYLIVFAILQQVCISIISNRGITKQLGFLYEAKDEVKLSGHFYITAFFLELNDRRSFRTIEKPTIKIISCLLEILHNYTYDLMIFE